MPLAERLGDRHGDLGLGLDDLGAVFLDGRLHFLLSGHGEGAAFLGLGAGDPRVGFGLKGLQVGADVVADVDIGDVDRQDLVGRAGVEPFLEHSLGDRCRASRAPAGGFRPSRWH